jgi:hypothetical protein
MSLVQEPNYNDYIDRLVLILQNSTVLFPKTIGGDQNAKDLVNQVIKYDLAIAQDAPTGLGPPHIFVSTANNPIVSDEHIGRDTRDEFGPRDMKLEFWVVCVTNQPEFAGAQQSLFNIVQAVKQTLGKNKRLEDLAGANPLAREIDRPIVTPFTNWISTEKTTLATTVVIRPNVIVNLRT